MLAPRFYPYIGGVEKHIYKISLELIKNGHQVSVLTQKQDNNLARFEEKEKIKIFRFSPCNRIQLWWWIFHNRYLIQDSDIIHCHDYDTFISWYLPFRFLYPKKPVYVTFHGYEGYPLKRKTIFLRKITEKLTWGNICIGDFITKWYGTKANFISYGGVDLLITSEVKEVPQLGCLENTGQRHNNKAIFIGRLEKDTGIMDYLKTLQIIKKKYKMNLPLIICGDGSLKNKIQEYVKDNKLNVQLLGFVDDPLCYLQQAKYAFVSGYLAILEAMINKKIVVSIYDNPIKRDYLLMHQQTDSIIIDESPEKLAEKISHLSNEDYLKNTNNAYIWAKKQTWEHLTKIYLQLWQK